MSVARPRRADSAGCRARDPNQEQKGQQGIPAHDPRRSRRKPGPAGDAAADDDPQQKGEHHGLLVPIVSSVLSWVIQASKPSKRGASAEPSAKMTPACDNCRRSKVRCIHRVPIGGGQGMQAYPAHISCSVCDQQADWRLQNWPTLLRRANAKPRMMAKKR